MNIDELCMSMPNSLSECCIYWSAVCLLINKTECDQFVEKQLYLFTWPSNQFVTIII